MYPKSWREDRRWYAGMTSYWDASLGNITELEGQGNVGQHIACNDD